MQITEEAGRSIFYGDGPIKVSQQLHGSGIPLMKSDDALILRFERPGRLNHWTFRTSAEVAL